MRILVLVLMILFVACSDQPSREKFPGPPGRTTELQAAQAQQAVMGGTNPLAPPIAGGGERVPPHATAKDGVDYAEPATAPTGPAETLEGVIELGKGVKPVGTFLFLSVRPAEGGPPLAARKIENPKLPLKFSLSSADVMIPGTPFTGEVVVTARLKQDANPLLRVKGDLSAQKPTKVGDHKVKLVLDQVE